MIYLDNAATSFPKPEAVYQALDRFARAIAGQSGPGRAQDGPRRRACPRRRPASASTSSFTAKGPERFVFTLNCTDALNMAFKGVLQRGRSRHHHRSGAQQRQPAAAGDGAGRLD